MKTILPAIILSIARLAAASELPWDDYGHLAKKLAAIAPTPIGTSHLGRLESGAWVQVRFPVPKSRPAGFWADLSNIVGYTGRGTAYQLVVRVDSNTGPVVYTGPQIASGDAWNAANRERISLSKAITAQHATQGYVDVFASGIVERDGWTLYRHNPAGRRILAHSFVLSAKEQAQILTAKALEARGIALLPMPQEVQLRESGFRCSPTTRLTLSPETNEAQIFAANELAEALRELGLEAQVVKTKTPDKKRDIVLAVRPGSIGKAQGYRIETNAQQARAVAEDEAGLFYAAQTLRQLIKRDGRSVVLTGAAITDWPAFPIRGFQYDIARGQTVNVEFCKQIIRESARVKMNAIMFYLEDDYKFEKYPFLGRPDRFDKAKAQTLSAYAKQRHMQLIPQYESLGHASTMLGHDEMAKLREAGGSWVFCTSEPETWRFFDTAFAELAEAFSNSRYIHVGGDEFESGFAKCTRCKVKAEKDGVGGLYVEHMGKLNELVKKHGRRMLFWPSHGGPTPELSYMSLKYQDKMPKDCIPTEWIYHGPSSYPQIEEYQQAGYADVWCCPAVVGYSSLYPDYTTTFRGIRGFFRAGHERKCRAAMTTTWEFMHGALFHNAWYGLMYTAECAWSLGSTAQRDFGWRFVRHWFGLSDPDQADRLAEVLAWPIPQTGPTAICRSRKLIRDLMWAEPAALRPRFIQKQRFPQDSAPCIAAAGVSAAEELSKFARIVKRNAATIRFAVAACKMYEYTAKKVTLLDELAKLYAAAHNAPTPQGNQKSLVECAAAVSTILADCDAIAGHFADAVEHYGGYEGDLTRMQKQKASWEAMGKRFQTLAANSRADKPAPLPLPSEFGLGNKQYIKAGSWSPAMVKEERAEITWPLKALPAQAGPVSLEFEYVRGAHGLRIYRVCAMVDGKEVAIDEHTGWAGAGSHSNRYVLKLPKLPQGVKLELKADVASSGGTHSYGDVWLTVDQP